jgi:hypothetical protein
MFELTNDVEQSSGRRDVERDLTPIIAQVDGSLKDTFVPPDLASRAYPVASLGICAHVGIGRA